MSLVKQQNDLQSGGKLSLEKFTELCESEYKVKYNSMVERYQEEKHHLVMQKERKVKEFEMINAIIRVNTEAQNGNISPANIIAVEKELASLNYDSVGASFTIDYWRIQYGEKMIVPILCDIMDYFLRQFEVKEKLTDVQVVQLVMKLMASQPLLRIRELLFVLNRALAGGYGPTYQRVGIDTILGWLSKFYEESSAHLEQARINASNEESRGSEPWQQMDKKMKAYEDEQRAKKLVNDKVWKMEERRRQVEDYKNSLSEGTNG